MSVARVVAKGLEGVIVDTSNICLIDGNAGRLVYRGYDIHDLTATVDFEEAAYLLWNGDLPTQSQLADLRKRLSDERPISSNLKATIANLPRSSNTLDVLRTAVSALGTGSSLKKPDISDAIAITAKMPTINATFDRIRRGQEPVEPKSDLGHAANYLYMLTGKEPDPVKVDALNKYLILLGRRNECLNFHCENCSLNLGGHVLCHYRCYRSPEGPASRRGTGACSTNAEGYRQT